MDRYFENEYAACELKENILFFEYKKDVVINLASAKVIIADRIRFQREKAYPVLCDIRAIVDFDKEGRDYLAQHGSVLTKAVGIFGHGTVSILMVSFYLKINAPQVPTKVFTDKTAALEFLKNFV
jgi:hypothetical protein